MVYVCSSINLLTSKFGYFEHETKEKFNKNKMKFNKLY